MSASNQNASNTGGAVTMLPETFHFTQSNLQDYVDCQRRFQLRYVLGQAWPGVQAEPFLEHEDFLERGAQFHRLVERHQLGLDPDLIERSITDPDVLRWWHDYLAFEPLHALEGDRYPEFILVGELAGFRLAAMYDLLVDVPDGRLVIFDWKTYRRLPQPRQVAERVQTRLYPFLAVLAGSRFAGRALAPADVSMVYWFSAEPAAPLTFDYSQEQFEADRAFLLRLLREIDTRGEEQWPLVADDRFCRYCVFRSLCGRGKQAGNVEEFATMYDELEAVDLGLTLEEVAEVGF